MDGISRSEISGGCKTLDMEVEAFRDRPIEGEYPYVWLEEVRPLEPITEATRSARKLAEALTGRGEPSSQRSNRRAGGDGPHIGRDRNGE